MNALHTIIAISSAVILFLFGIENFSKEIQRVTGEKFRRFLSKGTKNPLVGCLLGALVTSVIQSSTATSVIAVGLVNAGVLSFRNSLGIIFGANIGTTVTAQLVAFKLTAIAPVFIVLGFLLSFTKMKYSFIGKSVFFFGLVFFSLNLLTTVTSPAQTDPELIKLLSHLNGPWLGVLVGTLFTAVVQSSSVTTGIAVVMVQNGLITFDAAIPIILGSNVGTTITSAIASSKMDSAAKRTAMSHFLYNVAGVLIFLPIIVKFGLSTNSPADAASMLANVHLVFNLSTATLFLILLRPFARLLERLIPADSDDIMGTIVFPHQDELDTPKKRLSVLDKFIDQSLEILRVNYRLVTLALESKEEALLKKSIKNQSYLDFIKSEVNQFVTDTSYAIIDTPGSKQLVNKVNRIDYIYQISDSLDELITLASERVETRIAFSVETLTSVREISDKILDIFDLLCSDREPSAKNDQEINAAMKHYALAVAKTYSTLLAMMASQEDNNAVILTRFLSLNHRIKDKLASLRKLSITPNGLLIEDSDK